MKTIDVLKDALRVSPDRARTFIARAAEDDDVTEEECAELVALAVKLGAIKKEDLLRAGDGPMKKSEMQEKFRRQLERRQEDMIREIRNGDRTTAMIYYGNICGLADAMRIVGLVDWEQSTYIREQAMELYKREWEA